MIIMLIWKLCNSVVNIVQLSLINALFLVITQRIVVISYWSLIKIEFYFVEWIQVAQKEVQWRSQVNMALNFGTVQEEGLCYADLFTCRN